MMRKQRHLYKKRRAKTGAISKIVIAAIYMAHGNKNIAQKN